MTFDRQMFSNKLQRYCNQFDINNRDLSNATGISQQRVESLLMKQSDPTGDEVLIIADYFKCDFKFFISNEQLAPFEQTEKLFRAHGGALNTEDRWAIQEFLFLCECQEFLMRNRQVSFDRSSFIYKKLGNNFKRHGKYAAAALRRHLGFGVNDIPADIYKIFRSIGIHIFRRKLGQSNISGLFIRHPIAGPCVLVNYSDDVYRQRFTAAHEAAHAILDAGEEIVVSFSVWEPNDLSEIRANTFASHFLMPPEVIHAIPDANSWDGPKLIDWATKFRVNIEPFVYALNNQSLISDEQIDQFRTLKIPNDKKIDPELPQDLAPRSKDRKTELLQRGLSELYVGLCFDAYSENVISAGRLKEMLLCDEKELVTLAELYGRGLSYVY